MPAKYDRIGTSYANLRKSDPRIRAQIEQELGDAETILNIGAGTGSYEPADRAITALEPSERMIAQRSPDAAPVIRGVAENLPFDDDSFDAAMAILTVHHWTDKARGMAEMRRVTRGPIVILTYDPAFRGFWLTDYIPELITLDEGQMPPMPDYQTWLGNVEVTPVPIPHDCTDGFLCAYWRRPEAYLDPDIRDGISSFWAIGDVGPALQRLSDDLKSGAWLRKYEALNDMEACDLGYRLISAWA